MSDDGGVVRVPRFDVLVKGSKLGPYEILGRIAIGGMAEIYLAHTTGLGIRKVVVIKRIIPDVADNEDFLGMFLDEARLSAQLHHPNIAEVLDIHADSGNPFFVMEYVHGPTVQKLLAACRAVPCPMPYEHAIAIAMGLAEALHHAHELRDAAGNPVGIVHRDVSPSNVLVTHEGEVKLVDFGVAKAVGRRPTRAGTLKGKIAYMSPEQCRGEDIDRRSDVFAMGIVLYEMTTGTRPFEGDTDLAVVKRILGTAPPPPSTLRAGYPPALERVVMRALSRDREVRPATARELGLELEMCARADGLALSKPALGGFAEEMAVKAPPPTLASGDFISVSPAEVTVRHTLRDWLPSRQLQRRVARVLALALLPSLLLGAAGIVATVPRLEKVKPARPMLWRAAEMPPPIIVPALGSPPPPPLPVAKRTAPRPRRTRALPPPPPPIVKAPDPAPKQAAPKQEKRFGHFY